MRSVCSFGLFLLFLLPLAASSVFGQGSLTPPGAPAPTMKTLDQVEARIPIAGGTSPVTISADGSYYLTGNLTVPAGNAIEITATNVTLDLNGFTLTSTNATSAGEAVGCYTAGNIDIHDGSIAGPVKYSGSAYSAGGFVEGIHLNGPMNARIENIHIAGLAGDGIFIQSFVTSATISHCQVNVVSSAGIYTNLYATVDHCVVQDSNYVGIQANQVSDCYCRVNGASQTAIRATNASNCYAANTATVGNGTGSSGLVCATATNCVGTTAGTSASSYGIDCGTTGVATGCQASAGSATAFSIRAKIASGCALGAGSTAITHSVNSF